MSTQTDKIAAQKEALKSSRRYIAELEVEVARLNEALRLKYGDTIRDAVLAEREANLRVARDLGDSDLNDAVLHNNEPSYCAGYERACRDIVDAINLYARPAP